MNFDLPATGTEQRPAFLNAIACQDWLVTVPLANAVQAQSMFLRQLNLLHRFTLPPTERFAILEALRAPVSDVQNDAVRKFAAKPLPFAPHEQAALESTLSVWHMLALGYLRCLAEPRAGDIYRSIGAPKKAMDVLGYKPSVSLADGIYEAVEEMRNA